MQQHLTGKTPWCCYLLSWENRKHTSCCFLLSVGRLRRSGIKFLIGNFTGVPIVNFIPDWESETVNQSGLQTILSKNWCCYAKVRAPWEKKTISLKDFFSSKLKYFKKVVYKEKVVIQNSAIKYYHEFYLRSRKDLEMLILAASFILLTKIIFFWDGKKNREWKERFTKCDVIFWVLVPCHKLLPFQVWCP